MLKRIEEMIFFAILGGFIFAAPSELPIHAAKSAFYLNPARSSHG